MDVGKCVWLAPDVRRVLADNPSPMTATGTNSYLIGRGKGIVILDPGPASDDHLTALCSAVGDDETVSALVVTHAHRDHSAGARALAQRLGVPILAFGPAQSGRSPLMERLMQTGLADGGEGVDSDFHPDVTLTDGQMIPVGSDRVARVIHTPGHMGGHIALAFGDILFSGDHAMGWASSLISPPDGDMRAYIASLEKLLAQTWSLMLPGHGPEVKHPQQRLQALLDHRLSRESEVLAALSHSPANPIDLAKRIYHDTPPALLPAAERNVLAHLIDLAERNLISAEGTHGLFTKYTASHF